ncbi:helicase associated domain-containing protein [Embleya scabrispora]|nr:helicase associated domain-containing protein [Embleya scabrispora]
MWNPHVAGTGRRLVPHPPSGLLPPEAGTATRAAPGFTPTHPAAVAGSAAAGVGRAERGATRAVARARAGPARVDRAAAGAEAAVPVPDGPRPKRTREQAWATAVGTAAAYRTRVGHLEVPRGHVETVTAFDGWPEDVRLGVWVTTTRSRKAKLPAERIAALDALRRAGSGPGRRSPPTRGRPARVRCSPTTAPGFPGRSRRCGRSSAPPANSARGPRRSDRSTVT